MYTYSMYCHLYICYAHYVIGVSTNTIIATASLQHWMSATHLLSSVTRLISVAEKLLWPGELLFPVVERILWHGDLLLPVVERLVTSVFLV